VRRAVSGGNGRPGRRPVARQHVGGPETEEEEQQGNGAEDRIGAQRFADGPEERGDGRFFLGDVLEDGPLARFAGFLFLLFADFTDEFGIYPHGRSGQLGRLRDLVLDGQPPLGPVEDIVKLVDRGRPVAGIAGHGLQQQAVHLSGHGAREGRRFDGDAAHVTPGIPLEVLGTEGRHQGRHVVDEGGNEVDVGPPVDEAAGQNFRNVAQRGVLGQIGRRLRQRGRLDAEPETVDEGEIMFPGEGERVDAQVQVQVAMIVDVAHGLADLLAQFEDLIGREGLVARRQDVVEGRGIPSRDDVVRSAAHAPAVEDLDDVGVVEEREGPELFGEPSVGERALGVVGGEQANLDPPVETFLDGVEAFDRFFVGRHPFAEDELAERDLLRHRPSVPFAVVGVVTGACGTDAGAATSSSRRGTRASRRAVVDAVMPRWVSRSLPWASTT